MALERVWEFSPWFPYELDMMQFYSSIKFHNEEDVLRWRPEVGRIWDAPYPNFQFVSDIYSDIDCFVFEGYLIFSQKMVDCVKLCGGNFQIISEISHRDKEILSKKFYIVNIYKKCDLSGVAADIPLSDRDFSSLLYSSGDIPVMFDFDTPIFRDSYFVSSIFCSDSVAKFLLEKDCKGVRFLHPEYTAPSRPMRFRTKRGIEEEGDWDPKLKIENTRIVETLE